MRKDTPLPSTPKKGKGKTAPSSSGDANHISRDGVVDGQTGETDRFESMTVEVTGNSADIKSKAFFGKPVADKPLVGFGKFNKEPDISAKKIAQDDTNNEKTLDKYKLDFSRYLDLLTRIAAPNYKKLFADPTNHTIHDIKKFLQTSLEDAEDRKTMILAALGLMDAKIIYKDDLIGSFPEIAKFLDSPFPDSVNIEGQPLTESGVMDDNAPTVNTDFVNAANQKEVGKFIQRLRKSAGLTQTDIVKATGFSPSTVSLIERGGGNPSLETLEQIVSAIGHELKLST